MYSIYDNSSTLDRFYTPAARLCVNSSLEEKQQKEKIKAPTRNIQLLYMQKKGLINLELFSPISLYLIE